LVDFSKKKSKEKREERTQLERDYAKELKEPKPDITECRAKLQKHFQEEDDVIRFRAKLYEAEHDERTTPFFFKKNHVKPTGEQQYKHKNLQIPPMELRRERRQ
jgi:hypothetical protein